MHCILMGTLLTPENQKVNPGSATHADLSAKVTCCKPGNPRQEGIYQLLVGP